MICHTVLDFSSSLHVSLLNYIFINPFSVKYITLCSHTAFRVVVFFSAKSRAASERRGKYKWMLYASPIFYPIYLKQNTAPKMHCVNTVLWCMLKKKTFWKKKWWVTSKPKIGQYTKKIRSPQVYIQVPTILIFLQYPMQSYNKGLFTRLPFYNIPPNIHAQHWNKKHYL